METEYQFNRIDNEIKSINSQMLELQQTFNESLVAQATRSTVQDNILEVLRDIKVSLKDSQQELKHAMKNAKAEVDGRFLLADDRISVLEKDSSRRNITMNVLKAQSAIMVALIATHFWVPILEFLKKAA
jgi:hypothetical protein